MIFRPLSGRTGQARVVLLSFLVALPLAGFGLYRWLNRTRVVVRAEMVGVWTLIDNPDAAAGDPLAAWAAGLTNQWIALGSKGSCWYHAPSQALPWLGQAKAEELRTYGETFSPVLWPGGPPSPHQQFIDEPGRRKPRELHPPVLSWDYHLPDARGGVLGVAQVLIEREGRRDGAITIEATRSPSGEALLRVDAKAVEGRLTLYFRRTDSRDIDAEPAPGTPPSEPAQPAPA